MQIRFLTTLVEDVLARLEDPALSRARDESNLKRYVDVDGTLLRPATLKALHKELEGQQSSAATQVAFLYASMRGKSELKVSNMAQVKASVIAFLKKDLVKGYLFKLAENNSVLPFLVSSVADTVATRYASTVNRVDVTICYTSVEHEVRDHSINLSPSYLIVLAESLGLTVKPITRTRGTGNDKYVETIDFDCPKGIPVEEIFRREEYFKETPELHELYSKQIDRFLKFLPQFGKQFRIRGSAFTSDGWFSSTYSMLTEGKPGRCIMDTLPAVCLTSEADSAKNGRRRRASGYDENNFSSLEDLDILLPEVTQADLQCQTDVDWLVDKADEVCKRDAPLHPTVQVFHLDKYRKFSVHVNNVVPYKYKEDIIESLVLPEEVKTLALMLVGGRGLAEIDDIIEGKSQSTLITCIGDPGVGKTLLAEVIAEVSQKPLYKVPADRLGGDADSIEVNLKRILRDAERWDAVLMIDEANAYVHARGADIGQNAIVGVFLRLVEYFKGTMILTTNQTTSDESFDIDDAVLSRSDAVIRLDLPTPENAKKIWKVQAKHLKIEGLTDDMIDKLSERYRISGRSIRKLLLNANRWANYHDQPLSLKHFTVCAQFIPSTKMEAASLKKS